MAWCLMRRALDKESCQRCLEITQWGWIASMVSVNQSHCRKRLTLYFCGMLCLDFKTASHRSQPMEVIALPGLIWRLAPYRTALICSIENYSTANALRMLHYPRRNSFRVQFPSNQAGNRFEVGIVVCVSWERTKHWFGSSLAHGSQSASEIAKRI